MLQGFKGTPDEFSEFFTKDYVDLIAFDLTKVPTPVTLKE
jgi:hypothetical protein